MEDVGLLVNSYWDWLRERSEVGEVGGYARITTPFLDRHNDYIEFYARRRTGGEWLLTDDGYTLNDLAMSGCDFETEKRSQMLKVTLNRLGIEREGRQLVATATDEDFSQKKHRLVQAIISVGDLFHTSSARVLSLFIEDVAGWLDQNQVRYLENIKLAGRTGYDHSFDFAIPGGNSAPERILQTINRPSKGNIERFLMAWLDTREVRREDSRALAIMNDSTGSVPRSSYSALASYDVQPILWTERDRHIEELAA